MASIEYEETTSSLKTAAFYGGIAILICIAKVPPLSTLLAASVVGAMNGGANLLLLWQMKVKHMTACNWVGLFALVAAGLLINGNQPNPLNATQWLALGCACVAVRSVLFGCLKDSVVNALNRKHRVRLAAMENASLEIPKLRFDSVDQAHQAFLAVLPEGLREEYRACITQAVLATHADSPAAPFQSSLGGTPLLPEGVPWPMWRGMPLDYLARINLAELPPTEAARPAHGILEFFYGSEKHQEQPWGGSEEDEGSGCVIFIPDPSTAITPTKPETAGIPPALVPLRFKVETVMAETEEMHSRFYDYARPLPADVRARTYATRDAKDEFEPFGHRVLSAPARVQGDMDGELALAARCLGLPASTPWVMLLQLESDKSVGWTWCDDGAIYFWVPAEDLAQGRLDRVWVILQSP